MTVHARQSQQPEPSGADSVPPPASSPPPPPPPPSGANPAGQLDDQQAAALGHALADQLTAKVDAGAQLYFAIYHHPRAKELLTSDFMTNGLRNAYLAAGEAYRPRR